MTTTSAIARELASYLSGYGVIQAGQSIDVEFDWFPQFELGDTDTVRVICIPVSCERSNMTRSGTERMHSVQIGIMHRASGDEIEDDIYADGDTLANDIADATEGVQLDSLVGIHWSKTEHTTVYVPDHVRELRQVTAVITVTFKELVAR